MVGARFRWNEAKPRRRLLLIRAWGARAVWRCGQPPGLAVVSDSRCAFERHRALARHYNVERCR